MTKTRTYFTILIIAVAIIAAGYIVNIHAIKHFTDLCLGHAGNNILAVSAAVCAFIFLGNKNYWLINLGCSAAIALLLQFIIKGNGFSILIFATQIVTFLSIIFLMNLIKLVVNK